MKKMILTLLLSNVIIISAHGQAGSYVGLDLGFNSIWIVNQNNYGYQELEYERTFGAMGGLMFGYRFKDQMGIQLGLNFVQAGQNYFDVAKDFGPADTIENKQQKVDTYRFISLNYLQIPIMFRYQTKREKKETINFHFMAGPVVSLLLSADQYYEADTSFTKTLVILDNDTIPESMIPAFAATSSIEEDKEYFTGVEIGFQLAVGVDIYLNENMYLAPSLNVYYGLTDLNSQATRDIPDYKGASHNFYGGLNLGLYINLGAD